MSEKERTFKIELYNQTALPKLQATSTKMAEKYKVTSDEKEFKIPHVNLAYDNGVVGYEFFFLMTYLALF